MAHVDFFINFFFHIYFRLSRVWLWFQSKKKCHKQNRTAENITLSVNQYLEYKWLSKYVLQSKVIQAIHALRVSAKMQM